MYVLEGQRYGYIFLVLENEKAVNHIAAIQMENDAE
jgi:hypothetical protein